MITLDQIRMLDSKVQQAVEVIEELRNENNTLRDKLSSYESKISELQVLIDSFKADQGEIEEGIQKALERLEVISSTSKEVETPEAEPVVEDTPEAVQPPPEDSSPEQQEESPPADSPEGEDQEDSQNAELDIF